MPKFQSKTVSPERVADFLVTARQRYEFDVNLDREDKKLALDDAEFALAEPRATGGTMQWDSQAAKRRVDLKRPCLTENRLLTFTAQVVNDGRQSKPAIKITAMDGGTKDTAEYFQGRIRQIEYECNADTAYDSAREQQVTCGRGFLRVTWDYEWKSFKRRIRIERIENQFSVTFGPAREYDCSDADHCFVINTITREEHKRKYGPDTQAAHTDFASTENPAPGWFGVGTNGEMIQEAEYWVKEFQLRKLCRLSNSKVYWEDELPDNLDQLGVTVDETRMENDYKVIQYIIDGADILGENEFPGPYIPIVPQWGREYFLDGRRRTLSLIRYAKDPQRLLNIYVSNIAEQISMMPKTPFWVPINGIPANLLPDYEALNDEPKAYMLYNSVDPSNPGQPLPRPQRETNEPPIMALVAGYNQCVDAIKASMGIYDASLGNRGNETSGVGINMRQRQSDNANFHFHDNEARTRNHVGRIALPLIKEMDKAVDADGKPQPTERAIRSEDGKTQMVTVGKKYRDKELRKDVHYELDGGNYGVAVETDTSYTSRRKEAWVEFSQMATAWPQLLQLAGDLILRNSDLPGADMVADRLEKALPPELRPPKQEEDGQPQIPPQVMQQFKLLQDRASQVIDGLTQKVNDLQQQLDSKSAELETRRYIAELHEGTARMIKAAELGQKAGLTELTATIQSIQDRLNRSDAERDRQYQAAEAEKERAHAAQQADADRQHQTDQAGADRQQQSDLAAQAQAAAPAAPQPAGGETSTPEPPAQPAEPEAAAEPNSPTE